MEPTPSRDLAAFVEGARCLMERPRSALGLILAGALLGAVGPLLQAGLKLPEDANTATVLAAVGLFPMELYFIPRFLLRVDAELRGGEGSPSDWRTAFEQRWLRAFGAKLLLAAMFAVGFMALFLPALVVLLAFGWAPMRVLLRGEAVGAALRGSAAMMGRTWRRAFLVVTGAFALAFLLGIAAEIPAILLLKDAGTYLRILHPAAWLARGINAVLSLWLSMVLLATFRRLEAQPSSSEK